MSADDITVVFCTTPSNEEAEKLAKAIVEAGLAACVQIIPGIRSFYLWEDSICDEPETLMLIKTTAGMFHALDSFITSQHSYEIPEVAAVPASAVSERYEKWLRSSVAKGLEE